ncbi:hypothetical protein ACEPPN_000710 [Leptodophora sp. 'Broadleaf-Isolate-01']
MKTICEISVNEESTAPSFCYLNGCDIKPEAVRDGPGNRSNGGFDGDDIDWSEFQ